MTIEIRTPADGDVDELFRVDAQIFGNDYTRELIDEITPIMDWSRFRVAYDSGEVVAMAGSFAFDMTMVGGATIPCGGITWVGVSATHRRQGLARRLLEAVHADIDERGEPASALGASEGGIYERFGYGIASRLRAFAVHRFEAQMRPETDVSPGSVRYAHGDAAYAHVEAIFERARRGRPMEMSRSRVFWDRIHAVRGKERGDETSVRYLVHADGYLAYRTKDRWDSGRPNVVLDIKEMFALTPQAEAALWHVALNVDLVGEISSRALPVDCSLPYLLVNQRAVRTTELSDGHWLRPADLAICFGARTYGTTDTIVIEVDGERVRIDGSPQGAEVKRVRARPDLVMSRAAAGTLLAGGTRATELAHGRRLEARSVDVLRRADRFFLGDATPSCQTMF